MPIRDPFKKQLAQQHRLLMKICRQCGSRNSSRAIRCRKKNCHSHNLRWKRRELSVKR